MEDNGELCSRCELMFSTLKNLSHLVSDKGYQHYKRRELIASASKGCKLCSILRSETRVYFHDEEDQEIYIRAISSDIVARNADKEQQGDFNIHPFTSGFYSGKDLFIRPALVSANERIEMNTLTFLPITAANNSAAKYIQARPIPNDLSDQQIQSQIQTWLRDCQKDHQCSEEMTISQLPTRVLDVSEAQPRLHISSKNERSQYACLSYCWGGPQDVLTTNANLGEHTKQLPVDTLPKTLQDAIFVCKTLSTRFLWIDALCIIQDSLEDKATEINMMGSIYRDATITIFAASAPRVSDGFLQYRSSDEGVVLPFYVSENIQGTVTLVTQDLAYKPSDPLDSRAWVLQESLLSRRRLIYGAKELVWRCQDNDPRTITLSPRAYDILINGIPGDMFTAIQDTNLSRRNLADKSNADFWKVIVKDFSSRGITDREDRLPAIGGVAAELQRLWKDEYIVGTWRRTLAQHLTWYRLKSHPSASLPRPVEYRAPTWSWASIDCAVNFREIELIAVEIISCTTEPKSPLAPFGSAAAGELIVKAKVLPMIHMEVETLNKWKIIQDVESDFIVDSNTFFVLFGFQVGWLAIGIIVKADQDGNFLRIGSFNHRDDAYEVGGKGSHVWRRPEVTTQELRIY